MRRKIAIIGGGSCALMLAAELDASRYEINIFESNKALGRKFLVAGAGGFNLTHSESPETFIHKYTPKDFLVEAFNHFNNLHLIDWLHEAGISTYTGSSKRIFPTKNIKPIDVLNAFLKKIKIKHAKIYTEHALLDFDSDQNLKFNYQNHTIENKFDIVVLCMGGGSWPVTGSNGQWIDLLSSKQIVCHPLVASNCAYEVNWQSDFISTYEGKALKNIKVTCNTANHLGELVITKFGIEGSGIYPLSPIIRQKIQSKGHANIYLDLKPEIDVNEIERRIKEHKSKGRTDFLKQKINLNSLQIALIKNSLSKEQFFDDQLLVQNIKALPLQIKSTSKIEEAISTVGGIDLNEITAQFELKKLKNVYAIGEMLDYDAPTGGYLLQSCFSMAKYLADHLNSVASK